MALLRNHDEFRHLLQSDNSTTGQATETSDILPAPSTVPAYLPRSLLVEVADITAIPYSSTPAVTPPTA